MATYDRVHQIHIDNYSVQKAVSTKVLAHLHKYPNVLMMDVHFNQNL